MTAASQDPEVRAWVLVVPADREDEVSGLVWNLGCMGITVEDSGEASVRLICFFDDPEAAAEPLRDLARRFHTAAQNVSVPNPDWVERFRETFVPFEAPPFRVVPEWVDDGAGRTEAGHTLRVDPGRAFGTGTHESTRLCLRSLGALTARLPEAPRTLDLGCGTGILGIAAARVRGARVVACDHDPLATASACRHARLNQVHLDVVLMDGCRGLSPHRFDLVLANLMAPFLISRADEIAAMGAPRCRYVLAGLLRAEEAEVRRAWPREWQVEASYEGEWASLLVERP